MDLIALSISYPSGFSIGLHPKGFWTASLTFSHGIYAFGSGATPELALEAAQKEWNHKLPGFKQEKADRSARLRAELAELERAA